MQARRQRTAQTERLALENAAGGAAAKLTAGYKSTTTQKPARTLPKTFKAPGPIITAGPVQRGKAPLSGPMTKAALKGFKKANMINGQKMKVRPIACSKSAC